MKISVILLEKHYNFIFREFTLLSYPLLFSQHNEMILLKITHLLYIKYKERDYIYLPFTYVFLLRSHTYAS